VLSGPADSPAVQPVRDAARRGGVAKPATSHRLNVDLIVVTGSGGAGVLAAKQATTTIPIVMVGLATDPVETGLVESLARPGGNITGLTSLTIKEKSDEHRHSSIHIRRAPI
jgi:hypothetical protein